MKTFSTFVVEAKDPNEYDKEGEMAENQLRTIIDAAEDLIDLLEDDDNLPEWAQNKITKAVDYLDSVRDYMVSDAEGEEDDDEEEDDLDEAVDKYTPFSIQNKGRKPSLGQSKLSSAEYQKAKKLKGFNADDWKWNGDLYIRVAEDVEESVDLDEAFNAEFDK